MLHASIITVLLLLITFTAAQLGNMEPPALPSTPPSQVQSVAPQPESTAPIPLPSAAPDPAPPQLERAPTDEEIAWVVTKHREELETKLDEIRTELQALYETVSGEYLAVSPSERKWKIAALTLVYLPQMNTLQEKADAAAKEIVTALEAALTEMSAEPTPAETLQKWYDGEKEKLISTYTDKFAALPQPE